MKRYFAELYSRTPTSIGTRVEQQTRVPGYGYKLARRNAEVVVFDCIEPLPDLKLRVSRGLMLHAYFDAANPIEAMAAGKEIAESILLYLSLASASECAPAEIRRLYDATPDVTKRLFRQWFSYDVPGTIQQARKEVVDALISATDLLNDTAIVRAFALIRKALTGRNYYDQFQDYWMSLEALNPQLEARLPRRLLHREGRFDRGISRFFLQRLHWRHKEYRKLKETRNGLFHASEHFTPSFTKTIAEYVPQVRLAGLKAITLLLELPGAVAHSLENLEPCVYLPFRGFCECRLEATPPQLAEFGRQPYLEFPKPKLDLSINADGSLHVELSQAVGKIEVHNATRSDSKLVFSVDPGPRRKDLKGIHTRGDGSTERLTAPVDSEST